MTKSLTEQWSEGTLPEGLYYIEGKGNNDIALIRNRYCPVLTSPYCKDDVFESEFMPVAPVPSYDEYVELVSKTEQLEQDNKYLKSGIETRDIQIEQLQKRLEIATKALSDIEDGYYESTGAGQTVRQALKEMEGVK